ncbi:hypothetical protein K1719_002382 [Acacia pycnantha]|nr:hypothetical protein K1719_002382 [Acacia pycnantha]
MRKLKRGVELSSVLSGTLRCCRFLPTFDACVVGKEDALGIVVLQECWGVDYEIKNHALKIPQLGSGVKALIPNLYRGKVGLDVAEAQHFSSLKPFIAYCIVSVIDFK